MIAGSVIVGSVLASAAEAAGAARARFEIIDHVQLDLHDRHDHELSEPLHRLDHERRVAAVPRRNENLSLIIGIDEPDEVAEHDAMLVAETRARQDHRRETGIGEVNRDAGPVSYTHLTLPT